MSCFIFAPAGSISSARVDQWMDLDRCQSYCLTTCTAHHAANIVRIASPSVTRQL